MKKYYLYSLLVLTLACKSEPKDVVSQTTLPQTKALQQESPIISERINGTAAVLAEADGSALFELYDNALIESTPEKNHQVQIMVYADLKPEEFDLTTMEKGRYLISAGDTIGRVLKTHEVSTGQGTHTFALLFGYIAKDKIKPETIIENRLVQELKESNRTFNHWETFIKNFELSSDAFEYKNFQTYYNFENSIEDPSPGFRIVLLFDAKKMVGIIHSRPLILDEFTTHQLDRGYQVSFFADFPKQEQRDFVRFINTWFEGVD